MVLRLFFSPFSLSLSSSFLCLSRFPPYPFSYRCSRLNLVHNRSPKLSIKDLLKRNAKKEEENNNNKEHGGPGSIDLPTVGVRMLCHRLRRRRRRRRLGRINKNKSGGAWVAQQVIGHFISRGSIISERFIATGSMALDRFIGLYKRR